MAVVMGHPAVADFLLLGSVRTTWNLPLTGLPEAGKWGLPSTPAALPRHGVLSSGLPLPLCGWSLLCCWSSTCTEKALSRTVGDGDLAVEQEPAGPGSPCCRGTKGASSGGARQLGPRTKSLQIYTQFMCVNTLLLEHSHFCCVHTVHGAYHGNTGELRRRPHGPQRPRVTLHLFRKKVC